MITRLGWWIRAALQRRALDREMREEMELHLEHATQRLMGRGLSASDARALARREFGNVALIQEEGRDERGGQWIASVLGDARFALRHFSRRPLTAATIILVLALGIGVNSALFSMVQGLTMRPAPGVPRDDALVRIRGTHFERQDGRVYARGLSYPELRELASRRETFSAVAGWTNDELALDRGQTADPLTLRAQFVTEGFFSILGVRPALGPGLPASTSDVAGGELQVVVAHSVWMEEFAGDSALVGQSIRLNDVPVRVAGIAPARFRGPVPTPGRPSLWLPMAARAAVLRTTPHALVSRDSMFLQSLARLAPGATLERANTVAAVVAAAAVAHLPRKECCVESSDAVRLRGSTTINPDDASSINVLILGGIAAIGILVLLVACTNVSALFVGAAVARRQEIAVRLSLGASRARIVRQLMTESGILAVSGGALGLMIFWVVMRLLQSQIPDVEFAPDLGTVAFTGAFALGVGLVFGLSPALHATRMGVAGALRDSGAGTTSRSRLQRAFIVAQVAFSQPLLLGIAVLIALVAKEADHVANDETGEYVITARFNIWSGAGAPDVRGQRVREMMTRVAAVPGVAGVVHEASAYDIAEVTVDPGDAAAATDPTLRVRAHLEGVGPGYFAVQRIRIVRGRDVELADTASREMAVVIGSDLARQLFGAADPVGKRLRTASRSRGRDRAATVVGVFDASQPTTRGTGPRLYTADSGRWADSYLIRTTARGDAMMPTLKRLMRAEGTDLLPRMQTLAAREREWTREALQIASGAFGAGALALFLSSIGLYGAVALAVGQRRREIGVRIALGARPRQVVRMFYTSGVRLSVFGIVLGLPISLVALSVMTARVREMPVVHIPLVAAGVVAMVILVASVAAWLPARRAAEVDPIRVLRTD